MPSAQCDGRRIGPEDDLFANLIPRRWFLLFVQDLDDLGPFIPKFFCAGFGLRLLKNRESNRRSLSVYI